MDAERCRELSAYLIKWDAHIQKYIGRHCNPAGKRILVVGSGWGSEVYWALSRGATYVLGIDPAERDDAPLRLAITETPNIRNDQLFKLVRARIEDYAEGEETFDYVVSNNTIEHIFGLATTLMSMRRHMKKGSRIALFANPLYYSSAGAHIPECQPWQHLWDSQENIKAITSAVNMKQYTAGLNGFTLSDFISAFREAGTLCLDLSIVADRNLPTLANFQDRIPPGIKPFDYSIEGIVALLTFPEFAQEAIR